MSLARYSDSTTMLQRPAPNSVGRKSHGSSRVKIESPQPRMAQCQPPVSAPSTPLKGSKPSSFVNTPPRSCKRGRLSSSPALKKHSPALTHDENSSVSLYDEPIGLAVPSMEGLPAIRSSSASDNFDFPPVPFGVVDIESVTFSAGLSSEGVPEFSLAENDLPPLPDTLEIM